MKLIEEGISDFKSLFLPFKYNDSVIFAKEYKGEPGFYGIQRNAVIFIPLDELPEILEVEVPDSVDELTEFVQTLDFIIQRIAMTGEVTYQGNELYETPEDLMRPFVKFMKNYEHNINIIEGLKNGTI